MSGLYYSAPCCCQDAPAGCVVVGCGDLFPSLSGLRFLLPGVNQTFRWDLGITVPMVLSGQAWGCASTPGQCLSIGHATTLNETQGTSVSGDICTNTLFPGCQDFCAFEPSQCGISCTFDDPPNWRFIFATLFNTLTFAFTQPAFGCPSSSGWQLDTINPGGAQFVILNPGTFTV